MEEPRAARLIHGNSWLMDVYPPIQINADATYEDAYCAVDWFSSPKRALLAPFGVGTVDQALLSVVAAKHFFVRRFALSGKVVILDEIHSYDLYTGTLIDVLVEELTKLGCTVIILSATLTGARRRGLFPGASSDEKSMSADLVAPFPLISGLDEQGSVVVEATTSPKSKDISVEFVKIEKAYEEVISLAHDGGAVLWIHNTVDAAQQTYQRLKSEIGEAFPIGLLHSRFPFWRRKQLENEWMERFGKDGHGRCGSILVSTQVVEQSVDLDADLLVTELAPSDMLLQRIGRLWRHYREGRPIDIPRVYILQEDSSLEEFSEMNPESIVASLGKKARIYSAYILLRTLEVWSDRISVVLPGQIRELIELTYREKNDIPKSWIELERKSFETDTFHKKLATRNTNPWQPVLKDMEGCQTRLNEVPSIPLVLCRELSRENAQLLDDTRISFAGEAFNLSVAQGIHKNMVRVPEYFIPGAGAGAVHGLKRYVHGKHAACIVHDDSSCTIHELMPKKRFTYTDDLGFVVAGES